MKNKNIYKQNERYFTEGEGIKILGASLFALAVAIYFFGWGYFAYILMSVSAPVGVFLFFFGASRRSTDADIDRHIALATEGIEQALDEDRVYAKRLDKSFSPVTVAGYVYEGDILLTRAKNGAVRSSVFEKSVIYVLKDALYLSCRRISLLCEEKENCIRELPFSEIEGIELRTSERRLACGKRVYDVKDTRLEIRLTGGELLSLPSKEDLTVDEFIERVLRNIQKQKRTEA